MEQARTSTAEELLQHLQWAKALARHLVADEATADDVVQESMVAALESPPRHLGGADGGGLRPWLGTVLRNVARQRGRSEGRRADRERQAAPEEALPSAVDLTGRAEGQRLLLDALLTLDEDSRHLVLLRYNEGLSAAEIARQLDQPAGSVRSRIKRALEKLRTVLDKHHGGDRNAWHAAVAPLVISKVARRSGVAAAGASVGTGWGLAMLTGACVVAALGLVALLLIQPVSTGVVTESGPVEPLRSFEPSGLAAVADLERRAELIPSEPVDASEGAPRAGAPKNPAQDPSKFGVFRARFVAEDGTPIPGVLVESRLADPVTSGADGRVEFKAWHGRGAGHARFRVYALGFAADQLQRTGTPGTTTDVGDIVLAPGGDIEGRVVDGDGSPLEGLSVSTDGRMLSGASAGGLRAFSSTSMGRTSAKTDAEGRFRLRGVCAGRVDVDVASEDRLWKAQAGAVRVVEGAVVQGLVITAKAADPRTIIDGVVLDHLGDPVPYTNVTTAWRRWLSNNRGAAHTDKNGRFLAIVGEGASVEMHFFGKGSSLAGVSMPAVKAGTRDLEVRLPAPRTRKVTVVDGSGVPVPGATIGLRWDGGGGGALTTNSDGVADLAVTSMEIQLQVRAEGFDDAEVDCEAVPPALWDAAPPLEIVLRAVAQLHGTVRANGQALEGAQVRVRKLARFKVTVSGLPSLVEPQRMGEATTDSHGVFRMTVRESGQFMLQAEAEGFAPAEYGPFRYSKKEGLRDLVLDLTAGGVVEGRVRDGVGFRQQHVVMLARGDGLARTVRTDLDGHYRFEHVTPGPCFLRVVPEMLEEGGSSSTSSLGLPYRSIDGDCHVHEGKVTRFDLLTGDARVQVALQGRLDLKGFDPTRFQATLSHATEGTRFDGYESPVDVAPDGTFQLEGTEPGSYVLTLRDTSRSLDGEVLTIGALLDLPPGDTLWTYEATFGEVRTGPNAHPKADSLWRLDPSGTFVTAPMAKPGESCPFPAGEVRRVSRMSLLMVQTMKNLDSIESIEEGELSAGGALVLGE